MAGALATVPMSGVMVVAQKSRLLGTQPPKRITRAAISRTGGRADEETVNVLSSLAHLGFGAGAGATYALATTGPGTAWRGAASGAAFGLAVWAISYAGWVPALRILPPPRRDRPGRPSAMVAAHIVYGVLLGELLRREGRGGGEAAG